MMITSIKTNTETARIVVFGGRSRELVSKCMNYCFQQGREAGLSLCVLDLPLFGGSRNYLYGLHTVFVHFWNLEGTLYIHISTQWRIQDFPEGPKTDYLARFLSKTACK